MSNIVWVNGVDMSTLGFEMAPGSFGWADGVGIERAAVAVPGRSGSEASTVEIMTPRVVVLRGIMSPSSVATRPATLDTLMYRLRGQLTLRFGDSTSRIMYGKLTRVSVAELTDGMVKAPLVTTLEITCYDPAKYDATATNISFGTAGTQVPLGTLPSVGTVKINGPATTPILRYHDTTPATQGYMSFATSLASGEYLSVDLDLMRVRFYATSGSSTNALSALSSGDFFDLDPADANLATGAWPTLTVSSGSGVLTHRRRWMT